MTEQEQINILTSRDIKTRQRDGFNGTTIDYIDAPEAFNLLNKAFGMKWSFIIIKFELMNTTYMATEGYGKEARKVPKEESVWMCQGRIEFELENGRREFRDGVGFELLYKKGMSIDNTGKGAITDAFKLAAKYCGIAMHLYEKAETPNVANVNNGGAAASGEYANRLAHLKIVS